MKDLNQSFKKVYTDHYTGSWQDYNRNEEGSREAATESRMGNDGSLDEGVHKNECEETDLEG